MSSFSNLEKDIEDFKELLQISSNESEINEFEKEITSLEKNLSDIENEALFFGEYDDLSAMLTINAGAGGVDAHDWAEMLLRMYTRHLSSNNIDHQIEEISHCLLYTSPSPRDS